VVQIITRPVEQEIESTDVILSTTGGKYVIGYVGDLGHSEGKSSLVFCGEMLVRYGGREFHPSFLSRGDRLPRH